MESQGFKVQGSGLWSLPRASKNNAFPLAKRKSGAAAARFHPRPLPLVFAADGYALALLLLGLRRDGPPRRFPFTIRFSFSRCFAGLISKGQHFGTSDA